MNRTTSLSASTRKQTRLHALLLTILAFVPVSGSYAALPTVVVDFDYYDTSGEARDQTVEHAQRMNAFVAILRNRLSQTSEYQVLGWRCPEVSCTAGTLAAEDLAEAARSAGASRLIFGGIHKMSTLVQLGKVYVIDLDSDRVLLDRSFTFRGDTDQAFNKAAEFVVRQLQTVDEPTQ